MRRQKRRILVDEATSDTEKLQTDQIKLQMLRQEYARFSKSAKLRTQGERAETSGFSWKRAKEADSKYKSVAKAAKLQKRPIRCMISVVRRRTLRHICGICRYGSEFNLGSSRLISTWGGKISISKGQRSMHNILSACIEMGDMGRAT